MPDIYDEEKRSDIMRRVKNKNTIPEMIIRKILTEMGYKYRLSTKRLHCNPDIVFPSKNKVIFINGCFWHGHNCKRGHLPESNREFWKQKIGKNIERDQVNYSECDKEGWLYLTIWQCEIKSANIDSIKTRLLKFLL
jgi:DNA mismatch endonuclease Vsr